MKRFLLSLTILLGITGFAYLAFASPVSVDRLNNDHIQPLIQTDFIQAPYLVATSSTATSTFAGDVTVGGTNTIVKVNGENAIIMPASKNDAFLGGAGNLNISGNGNTLVGKSAGKLLTSGGGNTFVGNQAGQTATSTGNNTGVGSGVLPSLTNGTFNSALGINTGFGVTTGSNNVFVGYDTGASFDCSQKVDAFNTVAIGAHACTTADNQIVFGNSNITTAGIGTTTPGTLWSIGGIANFDTATSTFYSGMNITSGCYALNGTCLSSGGASLTGTTGQVAYFSGTNTAVGTSSLFIAPSGNVGVGSTSPFAQLSVSTSAQQVGTLPVFQVASTTNTSILTAYGNGFVEIGNGTPTTGFVSAKLQITGDVTDYPTTGSYGQFEINGAGAFSNPAMRLAMGVLGTNSYIQSVFNAAAFEPLLLNPNGGNVGIGTQSPFEKLEVNGAIKATGQTLANTTNSMVMSEEPAVGNGGGFIGSWGPNTSNRGLINFYQAFSDGTGGRVVMTIDKTANVGVGSTTPGTLLSVGNTNGINFSTATSTFSSTGGISITNGCYASNDICNPAPKTPGVSLVIATGATTTQELPAGWTNETVQKVQCRTDAGTASVDIYHTSTHLTPKFSASSSYTTTNFTANNTKTAGEQWFIDARSIATAVTLTCTFYNIPTSN